LSGASTPGKASGSAASQQSDLFASIERLKKEQKDLKAEKKRVAAELRNAEKRRKRLRQRAKQLSDADIVQVLQMRQAASSSTDKPQDGAEVNEEREREREREPIAGGAGRVNSPLPARSESEIDP